MNNLSLIIVLLQAVLGLLSNPQTANNPQIQALANQAIAEATLALASSTPDTSTVLVPTPTNNQPIIIVNPQPAPVAPDILGVQAPVPQPSCTISGTRIVDNTYGDRIDLIWSTQNIPSSTVGRLHAAHRISGGVPDFSYGGYPGSPILDGPQGEITNIAYDMYLMADFNGTQCQTKVL